MREQSLGFHGLLAVSLIAASLTCWAEDGPGKKDIRELTQHFTNPASMDPWVFVPTENIREISLSENPGYLTIREAGKGQDIKGILKDPIRIKDYPLPWQFHMGLVQNYLGVKGLVDEQINWAIGLNLVVTFSDPSTWPSDQNTRPPDCKEVQLFVIHLGNQGENYRQGVPALKNSSLNQWDYSPETYLVYGRGDLDAKLNGNWKFNYTWVGPEPSLSGTWKRIGGPAEYSVRFHVGLTSSNSLEVGIGSGHDSGWRYRNVSTQKPITGIWEIGPIISLDHWIQDQLATEIAISTPPLWIESFKEHNKFVKRISPEQEEILDRLKSVFKVQPPDARFEYYVDDISFYGNGPENVEHLSEDFDTPGFLGDQKYYIEGDVFGETYSNPGYLTLTPYGMNGGWALCPILAADGIDLIKSHQPPFEMEVAFKHPDDNRSWNFWYNIGLFDEQNKFYPWQPCVELVPGKGVVFGNSGAFDPKRGDYVNPNIQINPTFGPELTQEILTSSPLYMLLQVPDSYHLRVGFKGKEDAPWVFSNPLDTKSLFGKIGKFAYPALVSFQGDHVGGHGWGVGNYPTYHRFLIDYIRYRFTSSG
jgi:hypothetical protein